MTSRGVPMAGLSQRDALGEHEKEWKGREDECSTPLAFRTIEHCDRADDRLRRRGVGGVISRGDR